MTSRQEERAASFARTWKFLHPALSWAVGAALFVFTTVTGAGNQSPEWYALIGALLGGPFVTLWKDNRRKRILIVDDEDEDDAPPARPSGPRSSGTQPQ